MSAGASRLSKRIWDCQRFGLTPRGLAARINSPDAPKVTSNSIPKAGTHLVERVLCLHPDIHRKLTRTITEHEPDRLQRLTETQRPGELLCTHLSHRPEYAACLAQSGARLVFVIRDPRDVIVSRAHFALGQPDHWLHETVREHPELRDRVRIFIEGGGPDQQPKSIAWWLQEYSGWLDQADVVVRFEDLVDPDRRIETISGMLEKIGLPTQESEVHSIAEKAISPVSSTFRKGTAGQWRETFDDELTELFDLTAGDWLSRYGYQA